MVECGASEVSEEVMVEALNFGHEAIKQIIGIQKELYALVKPKKMTVVPDVIDEAVAKQIEKALRSDLEDAMDTHKHPKLESYELVDAAKKKAAELFPEADDAKLKMVKRAFDALQGKDFPRRDSQETRTSGPSRLRNNSADLDRNPGPAAYSRICGIHPRRNTGAGHDHARYCGRCAAHGLAGRRGPQTLLDALQLPAVLSW